MPSPRSHLPLFVLVAMGMVAAGLTALFPSRPPDETIRPNRFTVRVRASAPGDVFFLYDLGAGVSGRLSGTADLSPGAGFVPLSFPLPAGRLVGLRLDIGHGDAPVTLKAPAITTADGREVWRFAPGDFAIEQHLRTLETSGDEVTLQPAPGATRPIVLLRLRTPLILPNDSSEGRAASAPIVSRERWLALALIVAGVGLGWFVSRRSRRPPAPIDVATSEQPSTTAPAAGPTWWVEALVVAYAATALLFSRRPDVFAHPQFWMEDGLVFFLQQHTSGAAAFLMTQGGYLHLIPRLAAEAAAHFPLRWAPAIYNGAALAVVLFAVIKTVSTRVGLPCRFACALAVVLVPNCDEIALNVTNAQWFGAVALALIALSESPLAPGELWSDVIAVILLGLSGPFSTFFVPVFSWRVWRDRTGAACATLAAALATALVQQYVYRHSPDAANVPAHVDLVQTLAAAGFRTGGQLVNYLPPAYVANPIPVGLVALAGWLALWFFLPADRPFRRVRICLFYAAVTIVAGGLLRYWNLLWIFFLPIHAQRYFHFGLLATLWLLLAGVATTGWRRRLAIALLVLVISLNLPNYRIYAYTDLHWPHYAAAVDRGEAVEIPLNPVAWTVKVPAASR